MKKNKIVALEEREWIKLRPSIYLGSTSVNEVEMFFPQDNKYKKISYVPALQKLFDEVLENSIDEYIRTEGKHADTISVTVDSDNTVTVTDNGTGLPIEKHHQFPDKWTPEIIFTKLRSGSNFEGDREGIGVNGVGVSLVVLFSEYFKVKTWNSGKQYKQEFTQMLALEGEPKVTTKDSQVGTGTTIIFRPSFEFFKAKGWCLPLMHKRVIDLAYSFPDITFKFNGEKIKGKRKLDYVQGDKERWEVIQGESATILLTSHDHGENKSTSFVNGANTFLGGQQIAYPMGAIVDYIRPRLEKKYKIELKPRDINAHLEVFVWLKMKNPDFSSQTKESLINVPDDVAPYFKDVLTETFYKKILANETIVNKIIEEALAKKAIKDQIELKKAGKKIATKKVPKLREANSSDRDKCTLFLTEGDSALSNSSTVRDTKHHAFLPLRGKILNTYGENPQKVLANNEIADIMNCIGLSISVKNPVDIRYGRIVLLTDADVDGGHISSLLINFFYQYWPSLFEEGKICLLKTPLYIAEKDKQKTYLYTQKEYDDGKFKTWKVSYFKGLAGLSVEDWDYFLNKNPQFVEVTLTDKTPAFIEMVFGGDADKRKEWLTK